jgi:hypothetical protein
MSCNLALRFRHALRVRRALASGKEIHMAATKITSLSDRTGSSRIVADHLEGSLKRRARNRYCSADRLLFSAALLCALTIPGVASSAFANTITQSTDDNSATAA